MRKKYFLKEKNSYTKIIGVGTLAIAMIISTLLIGTMFSTPIEAEPNEDLYDFGDAPDSYGTLNASNGARHVNGTDYYLGASIDNESDGQPGVMATGDDDNGIDDEDGIAFLSDFKQGYYAYIEVTCNLPINQEPGYLYIWIDFNADGDFEDAGELALNIEVQESGTGEWQIMVPCDATPGYTYLRARFSTAAELSFDGYAPDGEVEDYLISIWEDGEYPSQSIEFGEPKIMREWQWDEFYVVGPNTPVWINSSDGCPGTEKIEYSVWVAEDLDFPIVWTFLWNLTVWDNDENDLDETEGIIVTEFYLDETCFHEVRYQCWDYDGATEGFFTLDFFVDKCGPITTKTVGCPYYSYGWPYPPWISGITPLTFNSVDNCCLPNGTAVDRINIKVWWKADTCDDSGAFTIVDTIVVEDGDPEDINPLEGRVGYEFHFEKTGFYELEYWGVDMMGNKEPHHKQQHRVDTDPPEITKTYPEGGYCEIEGHEGYIKCCKPINLSVEEMPDDTCHAGLYGMYWRYMWNETYYPAVDEVGAVNGEDIVEELCIEDSDISDYWWYPYDGDIHFLEECVHDLYYFAIDNVANYDGVHHQIYYVDNTPPIATKEIGEPKCQFDLPEGDWCITSNTPIWINVTDDGTEPCISGSIYLYYRIWYDDQWEEYSVYASEGTLSELIYLEGECMHILEFYIVDCVGNRWPAEGYHSETFYVDNTEPEITKTVGEPNCPVPGTSDYCITTETEITLEATDFGCEWCIGDVTIEYMIYFDGEYSEWMEYTEPISFDEECEHVLYVRAYDCLGNGKDDAYWDKETFYVDETPPEIIKSVGNPKCEVPDSDDWCVTTSTKISLSVEDDDCCPDSEVTIEYMINDDEWIVYEEPFTFDEECEHTLTVRAYDCLGNGMDEMYWDIETFYVDDSAPEITKTVGEPKCDIPDSDNWCVTTDTLITLEATDEDCCPDSDIYIEYNINWDGWVAYEGPFSFDEECEHVLAVRAYDCLGNGWDDAYWDIETFYVDDSPPEIVKIVGEPNCYIDEDEYCVMTNTLITLEAYGQGCCEYGEPTIEYKINEGDWQEYVEPFSFGEECKHTLYVRAYDCLGNGMDEMDWDVETFYVDDTDPVILKTVGDPNCMIDDDEYCVTTDTAITIDAYDDGCCDDLTVWYRINEKEWIDITDKLPYDLYFDSECIHELEIWAFDCLGNEARDIETFYVDDTSPEISKVVGDPNCYIDKDEYCVTTDTEITIDAWDDGCCDDYTVWYRINEGEWIDITMDLIEEPYVLTFDEECKHELEIWAFDCLGNDVKDIETFYVDDTYPVIQKTVGDPHCMIDEDEYCVTTGTVITIDAYDDGCCDSLTVWYSVNGEDPIDITEKIPYDLQFESECEHTLEIWAFDCLGHQVYDMETFYVDDTSPEIIKSVGEPNCYIDEDEYCVTTETEITIEAYDYGCCEDLTVWYRINEGDWIDITDMIPYILTFDEECEHELEIWAFDCLGHEDRDIETFYVDDTDPTIVKTIGDPHCVIEEGAMYCVNLSTEITIDAYDDGCCDSLNVWISINEQEMMDITEKLPYTLSFGEECMHELEIWASDCLGHEVYDYEIFYVDEQAPDLKKEVGDPHVYLGEDEWGHDIWLVYPETDICFEAEDNGCCQSGGTFIYYRYWYLGSWTDWMLYDGCINLEQGCVHYLEAYATDCLGNRGELDNETFWVCGPGGDGDPNIEFILPEHDSTHMTDYVEVIMHAWDDQTSWEDLDVYLWIPGGRRDAPQLYYDVDHLDEEDETFIAHVPIYCYQSGAYITLNALALDEDKNTGYALPITFRVDTTIVWDQWMQYGWNPLPLNGGMPPDFGCNETIYSVLHSINGSYDWVFHYDDDEGWISYSIDREINELTIIEGGKSYWVHITNETGLRYYIGTSEIEILSPENEALLTDLNEINGTTWNSETGVEEVHIQIYYKDEGNAKHYWDGSTWVSDSTYLPCDLGAGYIQDWLFNSAGVPWIPGETFYAKARAMDKFGCYEYDMVTFEFEESCYCLPEINLEKQVWDGEDWVNETEIFVGQNATFNISISNIGEIVGSGEEYYTVNETILQAIDDGLAWLASQQNADGSVSSGYPVAYTGLAVLKWAEHATRFENKDPFDPTYAYSHNIEIGLNYLFNHSYNVAMTVQPAGDPDFALVNDNGIMFYDSSSRQTYETGIVLQTIVATDNPDRIVEYGTHAGWTYLDVVKDVVDYISFSQVDSGDRRGGFGYTSSSGGDNSNSQWPILGLLAAGEWEVYAPTWVAEENMIWTNLTQDLNGVPFTNPHYGSFAYLVSGSTYYYNDHDLTASGMIQLVYQERMLDRDISSRITAARNWIDHAWDWPHSGSYWYENVGYLYSMYAVMKASLLADIEYYGSHDWGEEYDQWLITNQYGDGHWDGENWHGSNNILDTAFALLILQRIAPGVVSDCPPCNLTQWYINDTLPAGLSYIENSTKIIVTSCDGYFESSGLEVQPQNIISNPDGSTTLEWWETGDEPFELSLCSKMYIYFNATVLNCEAPDGHINWAYVEAYSPDDESWVSDMDSATVWGDCQEVD